MDNKTAKVKGKGKAKAPALSVPDALAEVETLLVQDLTHIRRQHQAVVDLMARLPAERDDDSYLGPPPKPVRQRQIPGISAHIHLNPLLDSDSDVDGGFSFDDSSDDDGDDDDDESEEEEDDDMEFDMDDFDSLDFENDGLLDTDGEEDLMDINDQIAAEEQDLVDGHTTQGMLDLMEDMSDDGQAEIVASAAKPQPAKPQARLPDENNNDAEPKCRDLSKRDETLFDALQTLQAESWDLSHRYRLSLATLRQRLQASRRSSFPQFTRLPAELRLLIWEFAVPERVFNVVRPSHRAPAMAHACRESRDVVFRKTIPWLHTIKQMPRLIPGELGHWMFFAPRECTLYIAYTHHIFRDLRIYGSVGLLALRDAKALIIQPPWSVANVLNLEREAWSFTRGPGGAISSKPEMWWKGHLYHLPPPAFMNKTINLHAGRPSFVDSTWGRPDLARDLFRCQKVLVIDLEDKEEVRRVANILRRYWQEWTAQRGEGHRKHMSRPEQENIIAIDQGKGDWSRWERTRGAILKRLEAIVAETWLPLTIPEYNRAESRRVQRMTRRIVKGVDLRLVHVMELSDGRPYEIPD